MGINIGSLWGIRLRLNPFFILFLAVWGILGRLSEIAVITLLVFVHEFAHGLAARALGLRVSEVEIYPFGGVARINEQLELEPGVERRLAWAGPLANLFMAVLAAVPISRGLPPVELFLFFFQANLVLFFFNLLPALPLDGGRILRSYLTPLFGFRRATEQAARLGQVTAILMSAAGVYSWVKGHLNLSLLLVGIFLLFAASRERSQAVYSFLKSLTAKEHELLSKGALRGEQLVVLEETRLLEVFRLFAPHRYHSILVLDRSQKVKGALTEASLIKGALREGVNVPIKNLLR